MWKIPKAIIKLNKEVGHTFPIKLPNGELFTEKHLLNYDEMKEGEK